jgi:hypothetical protein
MNTKEQCREKEHDIRPFDNDPSEPFKCARCDARFRPHWLEHVDGRWQMIDYSKHASGPKRSRK